MKTTIRIAFTFILLAQAFGSLSQNVGINTDDPQQELEIYPASPSLGTDIRLSDLSDISFLHFYNRTKTDLNPGIFWQNGQVLRLSLAEPNWTDFNEFLRLDGKTLGIYNTGGSVFIGESAGSIDDISANNNVAVGRFSMLNNISGSFNVAAGSESLQANTSGNANVAVGNKALFNNTTGRDNTGIGNSALLNNTIRSELVAVGNLALQNNGLNVQTGFEAANNTAVGYKALQLNDRGYDNSSLGYISLGKNTTGYQNTAVGSFSLSENTLGNNNTAMGTYALRDNTSGSGNSAYGLQALSQNTTGANNTAIGNLSHYTSRTGSHNTSVGAFSNFDNSLGSNNAIIGSNAFLVIDSAENNVVVGAYAAQQTQFASGSVILGYQAGQFMTDLNNRLVIENSSSATPLIYGEFDNDLVRTNGDLEVIGNIQYTGTITDISDSRFKENVVKLPGVLQSLRALRPVSYQMRRDAFPEMRFDRDREIGLIAQELENYFPELVHTNDEGIKSVDYTRLSVLLLKGMQQQQEALDLVSEERDQFASKLSILEERINQLERRLSN